eukprot:CAMPEP_0172492866 /NCGR_PEP_ID=MMETSP1066-20121228/24125_1 /TAXON_ID=671091 /ORGANISM="Coscinodiscus wailesii, Strain CCMP2513" /LENGTH=124 /DNA_ID=CAMNT_0013262713 /DNA_START=237 /DNA_END=608 /DNA_ORIENTATION=-
MTDRDKKLGDEMIRNWSEIETGELQFDRKQRTAQALLGLKKEDVVRFWNELSGDSERRVIISEIVPLIGDAASDASPSKTYGLFRNDEVEFTEQFETENLTDSSEYPGESRKGGMARIGIDDID